MSRTIDSDLAIKSIDERLLYRAKDVERLINGIPTADVIPRTKEAAIDYLHEIGWMQEHDKELTSGSEPTRHGRWTSYDDGISTCSICRGFYIASRDRFVYDFCPSCGAKMDGKENNECEKS